MGAAYLLHRAGHEITLFEKSADIGGHSRTRTVTDGNVSVPVDTGFIVFNHLTYPNLCGLFRHLSVPTEKSDMTFAITIDDGRLEWGARSPNAVFGQRSNLLNPAFYGFIRDIFRFNRLALRTAQNNPSITLGELLGVIGVGEWYKKYFILPIGGAIWSTSLEQMLEFPALYFTRFFKEHHLLSAIGQPQWYTVSGGSIEYVKRLTAPFKPRILTQCGAHLVQRHGAGVDVTDVHGQVRHFDHAVLACHGDQALAMLVDASPDEQRLLSTFRYSTNHAFLHRDASLMPKRKPCWASWVYHAYEDRPQAVMSVTYWMNLLQNIDRSTPIFVTLNPHRPVDPALVYEKHTFEHPIYTPQSVAAQQQLPLIQGKRNTWFCGAHWRNGFHEDGLASAVAVARSLGAEIPW